MGGAWSTHWEDEKWIQNLAPKTWKKETTWELEYRRRVENINASQKEIECEGVDGTDAAQWLIV